MKIKNILATIATAALLSTATTSVSAYTVEKDVSLNTIDADTFAEFCEFRDRKFEKVAMHSWAASDGNLVEFIYDYKDELGGDINIDGCVNAADIVSLCRILMGEDEIPSDVWYDGYVGMTNRYVADVNDDGEVNIADLIVLKNIILTGDNISSGITETTPAACWRYAAIPVGYGFNKNSLINARKALNSVNDSRQDNVAIFIDGQTLAVEKVTERYIDTGSESWHAVTQTAISMSSNHCDITDEYLYFDSAIDPSNYPVWYKESYAALDSRYKDGEYGGRNIAGEVSYEGADDPRDPQTVIGKNQYHFADILAKFDKFIADNDGAFPDTISFDETNFVETYNVQVEILSDDNWRISFTSTTNGSCIIYGSYELLDADTGVCRMPIANKIGTAYNFGN